ncbi:MAG: preprotein translocase subunit SecE [Verrucomicrobiota bacterium]
MEFFKIANSWPITLLVYGLVAACVIAGLFYREWIAKFLGEVKIELTKCTWPWNPEQTGLRRYKELVDSTVVVAVSTLLLGAYVSLFDFLLSRFVGLLVRF